MAAAKTGQYGLDRDAALPQDFRSQVWEFYDRLRFLRRCLEDFFHPDHVIPAVEFIPALMEGACHAVAQMCVKLGAVFGEIFVLSFRITDAGVQVGKVLSPADGFDRLIEPFAKTLLMFVSL